MSRRRYRFRDFTMTQDPDSPPIEHQLVCKDCGEAGPVANSSQSAGSWAFRHLRDEPGHLTYAETATRPLRVEPGEWR